MNGASIRFSKLRGGGGAGGVDAWRDLLASKHFNTSSASSGARRPRTTGTELPKLHTIHQGTVVSIQPFGAFMQLGEGDAFKDGLLHLSCMAKERVETVHEAGLEMDMKIWVKVSEVKEMDGKYSLDMRYVSQKDGTDLDQYQTKGVIPDNFFEGKTKKPLAPVQPVLSPDAEQGKKRKREKEETSSDSGDSSNYTALDVNKMPQELRKKYEKTRTKLLKLREEAGVAPEPSAKEGKKKEAKKNKKEKTKDKENKTEKSQGKAGRKRQAKSDSSAES